MDFLTSLTLAKLGSMLLAACGLGLVIFIHELGHFAVAKWCGVKVERFSIGFGPVLLRFVKGETEYALSLLPLGGYVKMLGQDDADPAQMTNDQVARDPRSYTAKSVPQRMAIISAGVINNLITAVLFFILAFSLSVHYNPAVIGGVTPGMPAWKAGLRQGDKIIRIGSHAGTKLGFADLRRAVALSAKGEKIEIEVERNGLRIVTAVEPVRDLENKEELFPSIHTEAESALALRVMAPDQNPVNEGMSAASAKPPFLSGDKIVKLDDVTLKSYTEFQHLLYEKRSESVTFGVHRKEEPESAPLTLINVGPNHYRTLGLRMAIGKIQGIQKGSPADAASDGENRLMVGDTITQVAAGEKSLQVGKDIDVLRLPDFFSEHAGQEVVVTARREVNGSNPTTITVKLTPEVRDELERPLFFVPSCPMAISSIGVAVNVLHHVVAVEEGSPAAEVKIREGDNIVEFRIVPREVPGVGKQVATMVPDESLVVPLADDKLNWPGIFWLMQSYPLNKVELLVKSPDAKEPRSVVLEPKEAEDWFLPIRGVIPGENRSIKQADNIGEAISLGFDHTLGSFSEMYLTILRLVNRQISHRAVGGPIRIAETAYVFAQSGYGDFMLFLAMLSVSLAVLNFMPVPVLDGGHFMFLLWEGIRGTPANERVVVGATYVGLAMILSLMLWVVSMDVMRLWGKPEAAPSKGQATEKK
ncbi:MAG: RIP metalloprotease RseP [Planctomycetota bacterium]|nr:RIP metalloprotease RseP [Planctomycetota bacterium]